MSKSKLHINSFGHSFNPDFIREVSLAANSIQSFAIRKLKSHGKDNISIEPSEDEVIEVSAVELNMIYASATRIIDEMKVKFG